MNTKDSDNIFTSLAPIVVFAFIRKETLKHTINALRNNYLAKDSELNIFIDGPRNYEDENNIQEVKKFCNSIKGFKKVSIRCSVINKGLDQSVIDGVSYIVNLYGKVIVVEDDVVVMPNFLDFMNAALSFYQSNNRIISISGFSLKIKKPKGYNSDVYLFGRSTSWGWATWKDRWNNIDWEIKEWDSLKRNRKQQRALNKYGGDDMYKMLKECINGGGMWDIRFCYNMFKQNKYSIVPFLSKAYNIGFGGMATHCKKVKVNRFIPDIDISGKREFSFNQEIALNQKVISQRLFYQSNIVRVYYKLRNFLNV